MQSTPIYIHFNLALILIFTIVEAIYCLNCNSFIENEDTYRICQIFQDATISSTYSSFWMMETTTNASICEWGASTSYIECRNITINGINETRLVKLNVQFSSGIAHFEPADEYPWPRYMEYIRLPFSSLQATWTNFSNLPDSVYSLVLSFIYDLNGTDIIWTTLPRSLEDFYIYNTKLSANYSNLTGMQQRLTNLKSLAVSSTKSTGNTFDFEHLPSTLVYLAIERVDNLSGIVNLTSLPPNLTSITAGYNNFNEIILPDAGLRSATNPGHVHLEKINFQGNPIYQNLTNMNFSYFSALNYLILWNCENISGCIDWSNFGSSIEYIGLSNTNIDCMINRYSTISGDSMWPKLRVLFLGDNDYKMEINDFLSLIPHKSNIQRLDLVYATFLDMKWNQTQPNFKGFTDEIFRIYLEQMGWYGNLTFTNMPSNVNEIHLSYNNFSGSLNNINATHMKDLTILDICGNLLNGTVDWIEIIESITSLKDLLICENSLTGTVDWQTIFQSQTLDTLNIEYNQFNGNIDLSFYNESVSSLSKIYGDYNNFDGYINISGITDSLHYVYFDGNTNISGGIDFSAIDSNSTEYPRIWIDDSIYCKPSVYCSNYNQSDQTLCIVGQDRTSTSTGYCSGKLECENTCASCVQRSNCTISTTLTSTIGTSINTTDIPLSIATTTTTTNNSVKLNLTITNATTSTSSTSSISSSTGESTQARTKSGLTIGTTQMQTETETENTVFNGASAKGSANEDAETVMLIVLVIVILVLIVVVLVVLIYKKKWKNSNKSNDNNSGITNGFKFTLSHHHDREQVRTPSPGSPQSTSREFRFGDDTRDTRDDGAGTAHGTQHHDGERRKSQSHSHSASLSDVKNSMYRMADDKQSSKTPGENNTNKKNNNDNDDNDNNLLSIEDANGTTIEISNDSSLDDMYENNDNIEYATPQTPKGQKERRVTKGGKVKVRKDTKGNTNANRNVTAYGSDDDQVQLQLEEEEGNVNNNSSNIDININNDGVLVDHVGDEQESNFIQWTAEQVSVWIEQKLVENGIGQDKIKTFLKEFDTMSVSGQVILRIQKDNSLIDQLKQEFSDENRKAFGIWVIVKSSVLNVGKSHTKNNDNADTDRAEGAAIGESGETGF